MTRDLDVVVPGVRLCEADERHVAGPGTYAQHGYIYSSLLGELRLVNTPNNAVSVEVSYLSVFLLIQIINTYVLKRYRNFGFGSPQDCSQ